MQGNYVVNLMILQHRMRNVGRKSILKKLLKLHSAPDVFIEPTFRCNYGYNITIGSNAQINFDFCILDCALR